MFADALSVFNPDTNAGWDQDEDEVSLRDCIVILHRPKYGKKANPDDITEEVFEKAWD